MAQIMYADKNITRQKSMQFAVRIYKLCKYLEKDKGEFILARQILKSGTSIGANLSEAKCAISSDDFLAKIYISYKECSETLYWLELLRNINLITAEWFDDIHKDCSEIMKLLTATIKTKKEQIKK